MWSTADINQMWRSYSISHQNIRHFPCLIYPNFIPFSLSLSLSLSLFWNLFFLIFDLILLLLLVVVVASISASERDGNGEPVCSSNIRNENSICRISYGATFLGAFIHPTETDSIGSVDSVLNLDVLNHHHVEFRICWSLIDWFSVAAAALYGHNPLPGGNGDREPVLWSRDWWKGHVICEHRWDALVMNEPTWLTDVSCIGVKHLCCRLSSFPSALYNAARYFSISYTRESSRLDFLLFLLPLLLLLRVSKGDKHWKTRMSVSVAELIRDSRFNGQPAIIEIEFEENKWCCLDGAGR